MWYIAIIFVFGLGFALVLDSPMARLKSVFRLVYFIPYTVPGVVASIMWGFMYSPSLNPILGYLGVTNANGPLSQPHLIPAILNIAAWIGIGYYMTLYYTGLTAIPIDIYDAASIDGCGQFKLALRIKIPLLARTIVMTLVLAAIGSLQLFAEPYVLSSLTTVPNNYTPNLDAFTTAFNYTNIPYASTLSVSFGLMCILATVVVLVFRTRLSSSGYEEI